MKVSINGQLLAWENPIDKVNQAADKMGKAAEAWDSFVYWINPVNWFSQAWQALGDFVTSADGGYYLMGLTVFAIIAWMFGAEWPKKWIGWGWIIFWTLRGVVFA